MAYRVRPTVDFIPKPQIEAKADRLLDEYESKFGPITEPPVPVDFIAEDLLGFTISSSKFGQPDTIAFVHPDTMEISLNLERSDYLDRVGPEFTLAHEIGHWVLNHFVDTRKQPFLLTGDEPSRFLHRESENGKYNPHEFQANFFASCLTMPTQLLVPAVRNIEFADPDSIRTLIDQFKVSYTAMRIRLENLELIYCHEGRIFRNQQDALGMRRLL